MAKTYKVYKHTCPNGKSYIGITGQDPKTRWNYGNGYCAQFFGRAVKKYGWENIKHEILEKCETLEEANLLEKEYIAFYETMNPDKGYNCTSGGEGTSGHVTNISARKAISKANKTKWADPEYREKMIAHLQKVSEANIGRKRSKESIAGTIAHTSKKVDQYSLDMEFIATFNSMMDAARSIGQKSNSSIVSCCKGHKVTAHGYVWRYHGEPLDREALIKRIAEWKSEAAERFMRCAIENEKPVEMLNDEGIVLGKFHSAKKASKETGTPYNSILLCCKGKIKHAGNFVWRLATN